MIIYNKDKKERKEWFMLESLVYMIHKKYGIPKEELYKYIYTVILEVTKKSHNLEE